LTLAVCVLVLCVVALAVRAKTSQYPCQPSFSRHLSKAIKMCHERTQKSVVAHHVEVILWQIPELLFFPQFTPIDDAPAPQRDGFLQSFQFRPPPPCV
jgi:hypothetical protein